jgi:hypothetical protein
MCRSFANPYGRCKPTTAVEFPEMTTNGQNEAQPSSLSLSQVSRLIELEQIEMDRRVAERRGLPSNIVEFRARPAEKISGTEPLPRRRSHG